MVTFIAPLNNTGYGVAARHLGRALHTIHGRNFRYEVISNPHISEPSYLDQGIIKSFDNPVNYDDDVIVFWHMFDCAKYITNYRGTKKLYTTFELSKLTSNELLQLDQFDELYTASDWGVNILHSNFKNKKIGKVRHAPYGEPLHNAYRDIGEVSEYINNYYTRFNRLQYINDLIESLGYTPEQTNIFSSSGKYEVRKSQAEIIREIHNQSIYNPESRFVLVASWYNPFILGGYNFSDFNALGLRKVNNITLPVEYEGKVEGVYKSSNSRFTLVLLSRDLNYKDYYTLLHSDGYFAPSKAEGWNLNLSNMVANTLVTCYATPITAHSEYFETYIHIPIHGEVPAVDGIFFKDITQKWFEPANIIHSNRYINRDIEFLIEVKQNAINFFRNITWENEAQKFL